MDISAILSVIVNNRLKIGWINTEEPTLEDVFIHLTTEDGAADKMKNEDGYQK